MPEYLFVLKMDVMLTLLTRIQMDEGSGCTVKKTTAGKRGLRMIGSGSTKAESSGPQLQVSGMLQGSDGSRQVVMAWSDIQD